MSRQNYATVDPRIGKVAGAMLKAAIPKEVLGIVGNNHDMSKNTSDTVIFRRWLPYGGSTSGTGQTFASNINTWTVDANAHQVTEGVTPDADTISAQDITVQMKQYACLYSYSDKAAELYEDNIPQGMKKQTGQRMGLLREMIHYGALKGCVNKFYAGGSGRSTVDETISKGVLREITRSIKGNRGDLITSVLSASPNYNTAPVEAAYLVFCHTDMENDIRNLPGFKECSEYGSRDMIHACEIGSMENFRFLVSPELGPVVDSGAAIGSTGLVSTSGTSIDVYPVIVCAEDAFGNVALRGLSSFGVVHQPHTAKDKSDPLGQRGYIGAIFWTASFVQNDGWMAVLECGATDL